MSDAATTAAPDTFEFLLVHGSCHGAWCWDATVAALTARGHRARAIDLPGHGEDTTPHSEVTLDSYAKAIADATGETPVILVGHSMGGYPITAAAERAPEKIARLIYLCAYVPAPGRSLAEMRRMAPRQPLRDCIRVDPSRTVFTVDPDMIGSRFYNDLPPDEAARAIARLGPQPILPQETPLWPVHAPRLPRRYIRCTDDQTIPPEFQAEMVADWPASAVAEMPTSHSPFLSDPEGLADLLCHLAGNTLAN